MVRDRWDYHRHIFEFWQGVQPNIQGTRKQSNLRKRQRRAQAQEATTDTLRMSRCAPDCIQVDSDGASYKLVRRMFELLKSSGINALVYEAPLNLQGLLDDVPDHANRNLRSEFVALLKPQSVAIRNLAEQFESPNLKIVTANDWNPQNLKFNDVIHLSELGTMSVELAIELAPLVCKSSR